MRDQFEYRSFVCTVDDLNELGLGGWEVCSFKEDNNDPLVSIHSEQKYRVLLKRKLEQ